MVIRPKDAFGVSTLITGITGLVFSGILSSMTWAQDITATPPSDPTTGYSATARTDYVVFPSLDSSKLDDTNATEPATTGATDNTNGNEALNYLIWSDDSPKTSESDDVVNKQPSSLDIRHKSRLRLIRSTTRPAYL
jgi:hypothetical protein